MTTDNGGYRLNERRLARAIKRLARSDGALLTCPSCGWQWTEWCKRKGPVARPRYEMFGPFWDGGDARRTSTVEVWMDENPDCARAVTRGGH